MIYISLESLFHMQEPLRFLFLLFCVYVDYTNPYVYKIYVQLYIKNVFLLTRALSKSGSGLW